MHQDVENNAPTPKKIDPPKYLKIICQDTAWVFDILYILNQKFGYGQVLQPYDAYMKGSPQGFPVFYLNRLTIPMDRIASMVGTTEDELAKMKALTLKELPFDPSLPKPTSYWGTA